MLRAFLRSPDFFPENNHSPYPKKDRNSNGGDRTLLEFALFVVLIIICTSGMKNNFSDEGAIK